MNRIVWAALILMAALLGFWLLRPGGSSSTGANPSTLTNPDPADWPMFRRTYGAWSYSPLEQINRENVDQLQFEWSAPVAPGPLYAAPVVVAGVMYVAQPNDVIQAINAKTGDLIWQYRRELPDDVDEVNFPVPAAARNLAVSEGRVFATTSDAFVMALEASSGKLAWETQVGDYLQTTHAAGPIVVGGKVITGRICNTGACYITAHDAKNGSEVWRTPLEATVGAWLVPSYDPELDLLFLGTGPSTQGGPTQHANATLALRPGNGEVVWSFQHLPEDFWGMDHAFERMVVEAEISPDAAAVKWINPQQPSGEHKVLTGIPGKTGVLWTLDAKTGGFLWARQTVRQTVYTGLDPATGSPSLGPATGEVCPSRLGGKSWTTAAYSPQTKAIYASLYDTCMDLSSDGAKTQLAPGAKLGHLEAISVTTGKTLWSYQQDVPLGSVLTTAGGLVVVGDFNRRLRILDHENGKVLFETVLAGPITGYPISYAVEGKQYIAITGGGGTELEQLSELRPNHLALPGVNSVYVFSLPVQ